MSMHLGLETKVIGNDWKAAIDVAFKLANKINITVLVNYANQYKFIIKPDMKLNEVEDLKNQHVVIGV